jgi:hypothetical protein
VYAIICSKAGFAFILQKGFTIADVCVWFFPHQESPRLCLVFNDSYLGGNRSKWLAKLKAAGFDVEQVKKDNQKHTINVASFSGM